ncbi:MAG: hypothetical protein QOE61_5678 [Micromonosporaceae bacterium]|nr:hypothetical protein [Micromonosporaceae bacterium]
MIWWRRSGTVGVVTRAGRYNTHLEVLVALVSYLALTGWRSRTPNGLARDLGLDESRITDALVGFPGLFRRGTVAPTDAGPQHSYPVHARYARRRPRAEATAGAEAQGYDSRPPSLSDPTPRQDGRGEEVEPDTLRMLLDFVAQEARSEREGRHQRRSQIWIVIGVTVAALASVAAAVIQARS